MRFWCVNTLAAVAGIASPALAQPPAQASSPPTPYRVMTFAHVEVDCALDEDRSVRDCVVVREAPAGMGRRFIATRLGTGYRVPEMVVASARNGRVRIGADFPVFPPPL